MKTNKGFFSLLPLLMITLEFVGYISSNRNSKLQILLLDSKTRFNTDVQTIQTDICREYFNMFLGQYLIMHSIFHRSPCPGILQQDGVVERRNHHLLEVAVPYICNEYSKICIG